MVWGCRQAFLQMTSALTKEMTLTGEWQTDRQLLRQGCCRQQHWGAGAELGLVKTQCLLIITINWRFHDNTILVKEDGELKNWVEILYLLYYFLPYCCYCLTLSVALISTVVWVPIAWHRWSASGPQQLRGCWVRGAGERSINLKCPELDTSADVCNFKHILKLDKAWSMKQTA